MLRLSGGALAILSGTRHDPLGYDVRLEVFGTRDSVAVGLDARSPIRSLEPASDPPPRAAYRDFMDRFEPAYRDELAAFVAAVRNGGPSPCSAGGGARGAARSRSQPTARGPSGDPSRSTRST